MRTRAVVRVVVIAVSIQRGKMPQGTTVSLRLGTSQSSVAVEGKMAFLRPPCTQVDRNWWSLELVELAVFVPFQIWVS